MDYMDVEEVSTEFISDADGTSTTQYQCESDDDRSGIFSNNTLHDNAFCGCDGKSHDYVKCCITAASTGASHNCNVEKVYPEVKDDGDIDCVCKSIYSGSCHSHTSPEAKGNSVSLPFLDQLCENEPEDMNTQINNPLLGIPKFEMLLQDVSGSGKKLSLDVTETVDTKSVVDLLKDLRNELIDQEDTDDFGLTWLFEETKLKQKSSRVKSKAAKKRQKQLQKLQKFAVSQNSENRKRKFAQSYQELQSSQPVFDDHDVDSSITCPVCLEMYHLPSTCNPCGHMFCDPCLRRMTGQGSEGIPCPLCRAVISSCDLNKDFDEYVLLTHPDIYTARAMLERHSKFRHYKLPYTAPLPLRKRIMRHLIASRNNQSDSRWMSHDWFKFLLGCTAGMCLSLLLMLFNRVKSVRDARDVNIVFLSILIGASVTFLIFKFIKI